MEDREIVQLYWDRDERAIAESDAKYGPLCRSVALRILALPEDSEECVSDAWLRSWNVMPPQRPSRLGAFLAKITRNLALDRWTERRARKRGGGAAEECVDELAECLPGGGDPESAAVQRELAERIDRFLRSLPEDERDVFVARYWYMTAVEDIGRSFGFSRSKTASMLHRTRKKLRKALETEGWL